MSAVFDIELKGEVLSATGEHPFYVVGKGWTPVRELNAGDQFLDLDGNGHEVLQVIMRPGNREVYNVSVEGERNYFVGRRGYLVHNK